MQLGLGMFIRELMRIGTRQIVKYMMDLQSHSKSRTPLETARLCSMSYESFSL